MKPCVLMLNSSPTVPKTSLTRGGRFPVPTLKIENWNRSNRFLTFGNRNRNHRFGSISRVLAKRNVQILEPNKLNFLTSLEGKGMFDLFVPSSSIFMQERKLIYLLCIHFFLSYLLEKYYESSPNYQ